MSIMLFILIAAGNLAALAYFPFGGWVQHLMWGVTGLGTGAILLDPHQRILSLGNDEANETAGYGILAVSTMFLLFLFAKAYLAR